MIKIHYSTGVIFLFLSNAAYAAHPLITDDAGTLGKGVFQVELNAEYGHEDEKGVQDDSTEGAIALSYGISDSLDLVLSAPYLWLRGEENGVILFRDDGLSDVSLEAKGRLWANETLSLAVKPGVTLPTGDEDKGLGSGKVGWSLYLISTFDLPPFALHANLGYISNNNDVGDEEDLWHASLAAQYGITDNLTLVANTGIERNADPDADDHPAFFLAGMIYAVSEDLDVDFGLKAGLNDAETDYAVLAGIALRW